MKRFGFALIVVGIIIIGASIMVDIFGLGDKGQLGALQILGIDIGILFVFIGVGFVVSKFDGNLLITIRNLPTKILQLSPNFWILSTFLILFVFYFLFPVFFSKLKIQYFVKYIPYEWVKFIGNDILWTVERIEQWLTLGKSPFTSFFYPPLTVLIFAPLMLLGYPGYYKFITIITFICYIFVTLIIPVSLKIKRSFGIILLFSITGLFSYGLQFEMDRGQFNFIAFAACFIAIYLFHYHPKFHYFSYLLFSLGVQLKMYPIIFIFMFVKNWRNWRSETKRILGLLSFNILLLFVLGVPVFLDFIRNLTSAQLSFQSSRREDLSITGFVHNLVNDGFGIIPPSILTDLEFYAGWIEIMFLVIFALCLFLIIVFSYRDNQVGLNNFLLVICTLGALIIPSASVDYKLPLLVAPISLLLASISAVKGNSRKIILIVLILIISISYWSTLYPFTIKPYIFSRNFPALFIILISVPPLYLVQRRRSNIGKKET